MIKKELIYFISLNNFQNDKRRFQQFLLLLNQKRSSIPAVTHVDMSARIQTVKKQTNSFFYDLIKEFETITGCPILLNTSFNIRGEPIVCSPKDAFNCIMGTELDVLVIGNYIMLKKDQDKNLIINYQDKFKLD